MNLRPRRQMGAQSLVEFAFVLPIMLLILIAVVDVGRAFKYGLQLNDAAFQGARVAALSRAADGPVLAAVRADLPSDVSIADTDVTIAPTARPSGTTVTVSVRWQYRPLIPFTQKFLPAGAAMVGSGATIVR